VLPDEEGSWEENPPSLPEFIRRDLRWCQGNMQYFHFLAMPGLLTVSRCQLVLAIAMYLSAPAWLAFMLLGLIRQLPFRADLGITLFIVTLAMGLAPKLATLADVLLRAESRRAYGGVMRIVIGVVLEFLLTLLIAPVSAVAVTVFLLGLPFGRQVGWTSQQRDAEGVPLAMAAHRLWPQTLLGFVFALWFWRVAPGAVWFWAPFVLGLVGAIPIAMLSAHPPLGRLLGAAGLCRVPEESGRLEGAADTGLFAPFANELPAPAANK
jgi:membrane glycosyltransferase